MVKTQKGTPMTDDMTERQRAQAAFDKIRNGWTITAEGIREVIENKYWQTLGYTSFAAAVKSELKDVPFPAAVKTAIMYGMFDEGSTDKEVAGALNGVGERTAASVRMQKDVGIPASKALLGLKTSPEPSATDDDVTFATNPGLRAPRGAARPPSRSTKNVVASFTPEEYNALDVIADMLHITVPDFVHRCVIDEITRRTRMAS